MTSLAHAPSAGSLAYTFVDEEVLLGFPIWVAELELLVGNARGRTKPDQVLCFQLLQKLVVTLERSERAEVREFQRRCEEAVVDILLKGAPPPVRRLICQVLAKLYLVGDQLPLYSRVSSLQLFLGTREAFSKDMSEDIRLGALEGMAALYYAQGRCLSVGVQETAAVAAKYCGARHLGERTIRAALTLLAAAVEGVGGNHRHAQAVQQDVYRSVEKVLGGREASQEIKVACASVLRALGACGGAFLWHAGLAGFEAVKALCLAGLENASPAVRAAFAQALGAVAVASSSDAATESIRQLEKWPKYAAAQRKALGEVPTACLTAPFVEAASYSNRASCTALAQAWVAYLTASKGGMEEQAFVDVALRVLEMLGAACLAAGSHQEGSIVAGEGELGLGTGSGERPHAQACVLYVLRVGVIEQLGERGQRLLLDRLAAVLSAPLGQYTPVAVVTLEAMALLLEVLGEVSAEKRAELEPAVGAKVVGPHACLRLQAAGAVAALVVAEPSSAARLLGACLANLDAALDRLAAATAAGPPDRSRPAPPSTPRGVGSIKLKPDMNAAHGWAATAAALIAASRRLPLGIPAAGAAAAARCATRLIAAPQQAQQAQQGVASCLARESGYILLGALCAALPGQLLGGSMGNARDGNGSAAADTQAQALALLALFEPALGQEAAQELDRRYCSNVANLDHVVAAELWWRTAALQALAACILGPLAAVVKGTSALYKRAAALLKPTLDVLTAHSALQEPARGSASKHATGAALLQLRLLEAYACLPSPSAYAGEQEALMKLCMRAVRSAATGAAGQMLHSALRRWLNEGDAMLGPWQQGRDPLERALYRFEGVAGGPHMQPWQAGSRRGIGYAMEGDEAGPAGGCGGGSAVAGPGSSSAASAAAESAGGILSPYPQPQALGAALLEAQLILLGRITARVAAVNQAAILDALIGMVQGGAQKKKEKEQGKRQAAAMAAAAAALAGAGALGAGGSGAGGSARIGAAAAATAAAAAAELAPRLRQLAEEVLEESGHSVALQRAAADLYAASAQLGGDAAAAQLVRNLCKEMAGTASLSRRAALALAVGSVARAVGGLSLQPVLAVAAETLVAVAGATDQSISVWILHAMLLLANAAGLAFVPHLNRLLNLAESSLLSESAYSLPGLLPAVGRLANASVALLGPDYTFGSRPYLVCKSIINDMRALEAAGGGGNGGGDWGTPQSTDDTVSAALETVLYAQMLVLFAPQAVPAKSHLPVLVGNLLSRQPRLRKAAADTLRHLAERDAAAVLAEHVEVALFAALDNETDPGIASQIKATLSTLLAAGAVEQPCRWLTLCSEVVMAAAPGSTAAAEEEAAAAAEAAAVDSEDEDEGVVASKRTAQAPTASPSAGLPQGSSSAAGGGSSGGGIALGGAKGPVALSPRLRTRLFAAQLALRIPALAQAGDPRHVDLAAAAAAAKAGEGHEWLVLRLQQLVDLAFRMASGQLEALRPAGVALMNAVLECWGEAEDPVVEGGRLMELYQAQIVSTLRASLTEGSAPSLAAEGAALAASFLDKGLDGGDGAVLQRMMGLLVAPLAHWGGGEQEEVYAEWVRVRARVALLEAHAHCAVLAAASTNANAGVEGGAAARLVRQAQAPHMQLLLDSWLGLLEDYVDVCTQPPEVSAGYRLRLCQVTQPLSAAAAAANGSSMHSSQAALQDGQSAADGGSNTAAANGAETAQTGDTTATDTSATAAAAAAAVAAAAEAASVVAVGPTPAAVLDAVRPALQRAWPSALDAASSVVGERLPPQPGNTTTSLTAAAAQQMAAQQEQHAMLLDVAQMALGQAAEAALLAAERAKEGGGSSGVQDGGQGLGQGQQGLSGDGWPLMSLALAALQRLTAPHFVAAGWLGGPVAAELASALRQLVQAVLLPLHAAGRLAGSGQAAKLAQAVAAVLQQLPGGGGKERMEEVVAAARGCLHLGATVDSGSGNDRSNDRISGISGRGTESGDSAVAASALAAVLQQLRSASTGGPTGDAEDAAFVPCLRLALNLGVEVAACGLQQEQLEAASAFLADAGDAADSWQQKQEQQQQNQGQEQQQRQESDSSGSFTEGEVVQAAQGVVADAVQALAVRARQFGQANGSTASGNKGQRLEAVLGGMLALGAALGQPSEAPSHSGQEGARQSQAAAAVMHLQPSAATAAATNSAVEQSVVPAAGAVVATAQQQQQAAVDGGAATGEGSSEGDEWGDDPFEEAAAVASNEAPVGALEAAKEAEGQAAVTVVIEQQDKEEKNVVEGGEEEEEDWGDDPFGDSVAAGGGEEGAATVAAVGVAADAAAGAESFPEAVPAAAVEAASAEGAGQSDECKGEASMAIDSGTEWGEDSFVSGSAAPAPAAAEEEEALAALAFPSAAAMLSSTILVPPQPASAAAGGSAVEGGNSAALAGLSLEDNSEAAKEMTGIGSAEASGPMAVPAVRRLALDVLAELAAATALQLHTMAALRAFFQRRQAGASAVQLAWALQCASAALPAALARVRLLMAAGSGGRLGTADVQFVCEALQAGLLAPCLAGASEAAQSTLLRLLVPALVEVAAPEAPPTPQLVELAVKQLTQLATSSAAAAFRGVAAQLPAAAKQRLAAALQAAAAGAAQQAQQQAAAAATPASSGPMQRATVQLNFAAFKK